MSATSAPAAPTADEVSVSPVPALFNAALTPRLAWLLAWLMAFITSDKVSAPLPV